MELFERVFDANIHDFEAEYGLWRRKTIERQVIGMMRESVLRTWRSLREVRLEKKDVMKVIENLEGTICGLCPRVLV